MDAPSQLTQNSSSAAATSSTVPQIRSRITVVCAECKRLKLKCDRRAPCGSCTKRDTVLRCIYSPAAAEKVDLHSLNNRLIQVEAILAMMTAGQSHQPFQSNYPPAYPSGAPNSLPPPASLVPHHQGSHQHHHHYAAPSSFTPSNDSIVLSTHDIASIWLDDLDLGISWPLTSAPLANHQQSFSNSGYIKLEPSSIDLELTRSHHNGNNGTIVIDVDNSRFPSRLSRPSTPHMGGSRVNSRQRSSSAQLLLPALSIYYPVPSISPPGTSPSSSSAFPSHPSIYSSTSLANATGSSSYSFPPQPQYTKPQVTPALLALLPSLQRCKDLFQSARDVFRVRPVPFEQGRGKGWKGFESRCINMLGGISSQEREKERERKEKAKEARRARQIYFGGITGLQPGDTEMDDSIRGNKEEEMAKHEDQSLSFFAAMCVVLAIGAFSSPQSTSSPRVAGASPLTAESPSFFYALSQQALGVWDTHVSSGGSSSTGTDEAERMDYLLACLIGVEYLLLSGSSDIPGGSAGDKDGDSELAPIHTLVGKLVNAARGMGLGRDNPSNRKRQLNLSTSTLSARGVSKKEREAERERLREEWRRMILWEVMYYDFFTADALGHQPYMPSYSYSIKLPTCSSAPTPEDGEHDSDDDDPDGMNMQHDGLNPGIRRQSILSSIENGVGSTAEEAYLGARYRFTQLAQAVKNRISHPDCCCGYTLDQAASLEDDIRRWQTSLPLSLKYSESIYEVPPSSPFHDLPNTTTSTDKILHAQSCELTAMANLLVMKIYTPFLRHAAGAATANGLRHTTQASSSASDLAGGNAPAVPTTVSSPASQATVHAARAIIRAAKIVQAAQASTQTFTGSPEILPSMFDFYPLHKILFDSVVICAHAGLTGKASTFTYDGGVLLDDVSLGLNLLSDLCTGTGLSEPQKRVVESLYKRVVQRGGNANILKRKHDQVDLTRPFSALTTNGAVAAWAGETSMSGFDFNHPNGGNPGGQYQLNCPPVAQQHDGLIDMHPSSTQHDGLMDMHPSSASMSHSSIPPCSLVGTFPQDQLQRSEQKTDMAPVLTPVATTRPAAAPRNDDKKDHDKKHAKKAHVYPSVGIRVRPGKETAFGKLRTHPTGSPAQAPLMTSKPRPLPSAEAVLAFQHQHKHKMMTSDADTSFVSEKDSERSRSSSISHMQTEQQQRQPSDPEYLPFGGPLPPTSEVMDTQILQRRRFSTQDSGARQHQQHHQVSPEQSPFQSRIFDQSQGMYEQNPQSYDPGPATSSGAHADAAGYNTVSSPFSNPVGPPSSSSSPFASTSSGHPPTPTFTTLLPTPPIFGPQPPAPPSPPSPTGYFNSSTFSSSYSHPSSSSNPLNHHQNLVAMGIDQSIVPVSDTPIYDKSQQQSSMYDVKPPMDHNLIQQQHHISRHTMGPPSNSYNGDIPGQCHQISMGMPAPPPWPPNQQQAPAAQTTPSYWGDGGNGFRFYS